MALAGSHAQATPVILDDFSAFQTVDQGTANVIAGNTLNTASVQGGWRTLQVLKTVPASVHQLSSLTVDNNLGALTFSQNAQVRSKAQITYNGSSAGAPGTLPGQPGVENIPAFDVWEPGYGLQIVGGSDNIGLPVTFTFYGAGSSTSATLDLRANNQGGAFVNPYFVSSLGNGLSFFFIPLANFDNAGQNASIFSAVTAFQIFFDGANAATSAAGTDATISYYGVGAVPEPGTYALIGLGLVGMGAIRRRMVRK